MATITFYRVRNRGSRRLVNLSKSHAAKWQEQNLNPSQTDSKANGMFISLFFITYPERKYSGPFVGRKDGGRESGAWAIGRVRIFLAEGKKIGKGNWFGEKDG